MTGGGDGLGKEWERRKEYKNNIVVNIILFFNLIGRIF